MGRVRPLHDRVLVKADPGSEQKVGGIIVPDTAKEKPRQAEVVAVGSGACSRTASASRWR